MSDPFIDINGRHSDARGIARTRNPAVV